MPSGTSLGRIDLDAEVSSLAVNGSGSRVFATSADRGRLLVIDGHHREFLGSIRIGKDPVGIELIDRTGSGYVANRGSKSITVFGIATWEVRADIPLLYPPGGGSS